MVCDACYLKKQTEILLSLSAYKTTTSHWPIINQLLSKPYSHDGKFHPIEYICALLTLIDAPYAIYKRQRSNLFVQSAQTSCSLMNVPAKSACPHRFGNERDLSRVKSQILKNIWQHIYWIQLQHFIIANILLR